MIAPFKVFELFNWWPYFALHWHLVANSRSKLCFSKQIILFVYNLRCRPWTLTHTCLCYIFYLQSNVCIVLIFPLNTNAKSICFVTPKLIAYLNLNFKLIKNALLYYRYTVNLYPQIVLCTINRITYVLTLNWYLQ